MMLYSRYATYAPQQDFSCTIGGSMVNVGLLILGKAKNANEANPILTLTILLYQY